MKIKISKNQIRGIIFLLVLLGSVCLVIGGSVNPNVNHLLSQIDIGHSRSLADLIDANGKWKCTEITGSDSDFCNDGVTTNLDDIGCPAGFLFLGKFPGPYLDGCVQIDEANSGASLGWAEAAQYCFNNYGGRLLFEHELAHVSNVDTALNDALDGWEWLADHAETNSHIIDGNGWVSTTGSSLDSTARAFRCFIQR